MIAGLAFASADLINLRVHTFGNIEFLTRLPMSINAGLVMDLVNFVIVNIIFFIVTYVIFNFMIKKFKMPTPGRLGNYTDDNGEQAAAKSGTNSQEREGSSEVKQIVNLLGGKDNIEDVDACMTRLRVTVKDREKVGTEKAWKQTGALGLVLKDNGVQAIYGPKADVLKSEVQDYLGD